MSEELNKKLDQILGYLKTVDYNNKLILNKLNQFVKKNSENLDTPKVEKSLKVESFENSPILPPALKSSLPLSNKVELIQPKTLMTDKKISVQQRICYPDGKPAVLVGVEIFDLQDILIKKTRTNSTGKWTTLLDPGKYKIKLTKAGTADKPVISKILEIELNTNQNPIELDTIQG